MSFCHCSLAFFSLNHTHEHCAVICITYDTMRNGMYDVLLPSTGTLVGSARPGHMAATECGVSGQMDGQRGRHTLDVSAVSPAEFSLVCRPL